MLTPEQVPNVVAQAAHDVFWNAVYNGKPIDLEIEFHWLFHYAVAAAVNAWPGVGNAAIPHWPGPHQEIEQRPSIILPLKEPRDE